jgi:hypothetical protein
LDTRLKRAHNSVDRHHVIAVGHIAVGHLMNIRPPLEARPLPLPVTAHQQADVIGQGCCVNQRVELLIRQLVASVLVLDRLPDPVEDKTLKEGAALVVGCDSSCGPSSPCDSAAPSSSGFSGAGC